MSRKKNSYKPHAWEALGGDHTFAKIYHSMFEHEAFIELTSSAKVIYLLLKGEYKGDYSDTRVGRNRVICPYTDLCARSGCTTDTVSKALKELVDFGFIRVVVPGGFNQPSVYEFCDGWKTVDIKSVTRRCRKKKP